MMMASLCDGSGGGCTGATPVWRTAIISPSSPSLLLLLVLAFPEALASSLSSSFFFFVYSFYPHFAGHFIFLRCPL